MLSLLLAQERCLCRGRRTSFPLSIDYGTVISAIEDLASVVRISSKKAHTPFSTQSAAHDPHLQRCIPFVFGVEGDRLIGPRLCPGRVPSPS